MTPPTPDRPVIANLALVWSSIADLVAGLDNAAWDQSTDCPGWSVRDQVSHLIGTESMLLGRSAPAAVNAASAPHVKNPLGQANEAWVAERRGHSGNEVLAEFHEVTSARLDRLRAMTDDELAAETQGPIGPMPYATFMEIRVMDCWVHEQDIRRAVGRPGHQDGPVVLAALGRLTGSFGYIVGKRAGVPDGATVVARLAGPTPQTLAVEVIGGKARPVDPPSDPTLRLSMSAETYACLVCGRWSASDVLADGTVVVEGDQALATPVLEAMAIIT